MQDAGMRIDQQTTCGVGNACAQWQGIKRRFHHRQRGELMAASRRLQCRCFLFLNRLVVFVDGFCQRLLRQSYLVGQLGQGIALQNGGASMDKQGIGWDAGCLARPIPNGLIKNDVAI